MKTAKLKTVTVAPKRARVRKPKAAPVVAAPAVEEPKVEFTLAEALAEVSEAVEVAPAKAVKAPAKAVKAPAKATVKTEDRRVLNVTTGVIYNNACRAWKAGAVSASGGDRMTKVLLNGDGLTWTDKATGHVWALAKNAE